MRKERSRVYRIANRSEMARTAKSSRTMIEWKCRRTIGTAELCSLSGAIIWRKRNNEADVSALSLVAGGARNSDASALHSYPRGVLLSSSEKGLPLRFRQREGGRDLTIARGPGLICIPRLICRGRVLRDSLLSCLLSRARYRVRSLVLSKLTLTCVQGYILKLALLYFYFTKFTYSI